MAKQIILTVLFLFFIATNAIGQSVREIEENILHYVVTIDKWDTSYGNKGMLDSLELYNRNLLDYLVKELINVPTTFKYGFPGLKQTRLRILTSEDKKFRIYYWDVGADAGTRSSNAIVQYVTNNGIAVKVLNDVSKMAKFMGLTE